jgi:hypothetical protein
MSKPFDAALPKRVYMDVRHIPRVRMGEGVAPAKLVKHVPKVRTGEGMAPPVLVRHFLMMRSK